MKNKVLAVIVKLLSFHICSIFSELLERKHTVLIDQF